MNKIILTTSYNTARKILLILFSYLILTCTLSSNDFLIKSTLKKDSTIRAWKVDLETYKVAYSIS
jgi:hypothetical protein